MAHSRFDELSDQAVALVQEAEILAMLPAPDEQRQREISTQLQAVYAEMDASRGQP